jgi:CRISPR system Cascade subunit CasB
MTATPTAVVDPPGPEERFIGHLLSLVQRDDRGALAALRRGLGKSPGEATAMHPHVLPWIPPSVLERDERWYYLVAALFAMHPLQWPTREHPAGATNLGASFARLRSAANAAGVERRFTSVLNSDEEDLPQHLRQAVGLLRSGGVPVDYTALLRDIRWWGAENRPVQRRWARAFWRERTATSAPAATPDSIPTVTPERT